MQKILYLITRSELGGAQRYVFDLARGLKNEYEISVAFGEPFEAGNLAQKLDAAGIKYHVLPHLKRAISPINDLLAIFEIKELIKNLQPDTIHLNSSKISILGSVASRLFKIQNSKFKINTVYTVHGWVFNEPQPAWRKKFYFYAEKWTARWKDKIICIDRLDYEIAKDELKIPEPKLALIHHGLDLSDNFLPREDARKKLFGDILKTDLPKSDEIVIGSIGNLYATKGFEYLIEAIKLLNKKYNLPARGVIVGEGPERNRLKVDNQIILAGRIKNAAGLLSAFDIYVCSSVKEGFPYSILEAMSAGSTIVSTNVGGIPDMISDGENGLLVESKNSEILAEKIALLINNPELKQKIAVRAKSNVAKQFTIDKMLEETKAVYEI